MQTQEILSFLLLTVAFITPSNGVNSNIAVSSLNESVCNLNHCRFSQKGSYLFCSCEKDCYIKGECCLGLFSEEEEEIIREHDIHEVYQHRDFYHGDIFKLVGRCSRNATNETEIQQCHNPVSNTNDSMMMFPMTSENTNITYKNLACARCNEGTHTKFQLRFECSEVNKLPGTIEETFQLYLSNRSCLPTIPQNSVIIEYWFSELTDAVVHCPSSFSKDPIVNWRCHSYFAPFTYDGRHYKNIYCAKCNGIQLTQEDVVCREALYTRIDTYIFQIDANFSKGGESPFSDQKRCTEGSVYDPYQQKCRMLFNSSGSREESITTVHSEKISNTLDRVKVPKCNLQLYNETDYEKRQSTINFGFELFINQTNDIYQEGEFNILPDDGRVEVCAKQNGLSFPSCVIHYCQSTNSNLLESCSCKSDCFRTASCCIDALTDEEFTSASKSDLSSCTPLSSGSFILAVTKCPENYDNKFVRDSCESINSTDLFLEIPVYSSLTNISYKNIYCGFCHDAKDLFFVPFQIDCDDKWNSRTPATALKWIKGDNAKCKLTYVINSNPTLYCKDEMGFTCPSDWRLSNDPFKKEVNWMCQRIKAAISIKTGNSTENFGNIYCAQCNGVNLDSSDTAVRCFVLYGGFGASGGSARVPKPSSLGVLFSI